jgi:hypothetical protein
MILVILLVPSYTRALQAWHVGLQKYTIPTQSPGVL